MNNQRQTTTRTQFRLRVLTVLALLTSTLGSTVAAITPAQASEATKYGYSKVTSKESYLVNAMRSGVHVLHVNTEHSDADGFWYAEEGNLFDHRSFTWVYQPFGMWCSAQYDTMKVEFNGWLNTHECAVDEDKITDLDGAAWATSTEQCRTTTGLPFMTGSTFGTTSDPGCSPGGLVWNAELEPATAYDCAPWEPKGYSPKSGRSYCLDVHYAWEKNPETVWMPAPDACTGLPADANRRYVDPAVVAPASGDGTCTGAAPTPNCPTVSTAQACTGVPDPVRYRADGNATATSPKVRGTATVVKKVTRTVVRARITQKAARKYHGRTFRAVATVNITKRATATAAGSYTTTGSPMTRTATVPCWADTSAAAQSCANVAASAEANRLAYEAALASAVAKANSPAAGVASSNASVAAVAAAKKVPVTAAEKRAAKKKAKRLALVKVNQMIAHTKAR